MEEYIKFIQELQGSGFQFVNLHFTDILGGFHTVSIPLTKLSAEELANGVPFDGSSVPGFANIQQADLALLPDFDNLFPDSISEDDVSVGVICNIIEVDTKQPIARDPRNILAQAEKLLLEKYSAKSLWLPELEFYLFDSVNCYYDDFSAMHKFQLSETYDIQEPTMNVAKIPSLGGYHSSPPEDNGYYFRNTLVQLLTNLEIGIRYHHHEVGAGQNEVELFPQTAMKTADNIMIFKYFARRVASAYDMAITFMPKPLHNFPGNGLHFHQWLEKDGVSLFWDKNADYAHLSDMALHYIAGLLSHSPALTALTNPSTNSFKRLIPGFEAPTKSFFGLANRSAAVRIPKYVDTPQKKRVEYRPPDASCNPYLAIAGMILAAVDGIEKELNPSKLKFGPFDDDVTRWSENDQKKLKTLPHNLYDAMSELEKDSEFLMVDEIFPPEFIEIYTESVLTVAREIEQRPTSIEVAKYFGV
ncbi:type I glutamate--ammonia ligase [bacterium]|nr:MAG: type I glutamate--ammonia ligase [bacterium]